MTSYLQLDNFSRSAQAAYATSASRFLCVKEGNSTEVELRDRPPTMEENRRSWKALSLCLKDVLGAEKVHRICQRYHFNLEKMEREGLSLLSKDVELFSIGASRMLSRDVKYGTPAIQKLSALTTLQLQERLALKNPIPIVGSQIDPHEIYTSPSRVIAWFFHDKKLMDKETQFLFSDVQQQDFTAWLERFAKCTVSRELAESQIIPAPGVDGRVEYYKVYRKISTGHGLVAYALKPLGSDSTLKPQLIFRPTQFAPSNEDAFESYLNNMQANIGELGYSHAKASLDVLMCDPKFCPPGGKIHIAGYSLGGTHAQRFFADHWRQVSDAVFYNDPSVEEELAERCAEEIKKASRLSSPIQIKIFRSKVGENGDVAHFVGGKHIGWGIVHPDVSIQLVEFDHANHEIASFNDKMHLHTLRVHDNPYRNYQAKIINDSQTLDAHLENKSHPFDLWYEERRRIWGRTIYWFLLTFSELLRQVQAKLGIQILRSSQDQDARS